jgi:pimeloyl-ACP methyl ester carboxylesterase
MDRRGLSRRSVIGLLGATAVAAAAPDRAQPAGPSTARLFSTESGRGRNVLLLHGWTADSNDWSWQLPVLGSRYRTVAVDLRGHGRSEVMPSGRYNPSDYVADLEALIDTRYQNERFVVIGHSMGGQLAARLAAKRPDLVAAIVSVDGSLGFSESLGPVFAKTAADLNRGDPGVVAPALFDVFYDPKTQPAFKVWHARRVQGMPAHVVQESFGPLFLGDDQIGVGSRSEAFCRKLVVPVYHLCRDPVQSQRMQTWFPHAESKVELWDHAGHWIMQDRPDDLNAALTMWIDGL